MYFNDKIFCDTENMHEFFLHVSGSKTEKLTIEPTCAISKKLFLNISDLKLHGDVYNVLEMRMNI